MTTLRELEFEIGANTDALNRAFPALNKLDQTISNLEKSVTRMAQNYESQMKRMTDASTRQSASVGKAANGTKVAAEKNRMVLKDMTDRVSKLNDRLKAVNKPGLMGNNVNSLKAFDRALKDPTRSTAELSLAKAKLQRTLKNSETALRSHTTAQQQGDRAARTASNAMERQAVSLTKAEIEYNKLMRSLQSTKASQARIDDLNASFGRLSTTMTSGPLTSTQAAQAQATFAKEIDRVKTASNHGSKGLQNLGERATDLAKSVQIALGPLSGVASRITAIASLANRSTIMIAGLIGAVIGLGTAMFQSIMAGARFEKQMYRLEAILSMSGEAAIFSAEEIDDMARRLGRATLTSQSLARDAAATLLMNRKIGKEFFESALLVAQGLSVIGEGTIQSNIRRVSRLLEDPAQNLTALSELGVRFNAVEQRKIKLLQQSGDLFGAQSEVMKRLDPLMKAATGEAKGLAGAWDSLLETFTDFVVGTTRTSGVLTGVAAVIVDIDKNIQDLMTDMNLAVNIGFGFRAVVETLGGALRILVNNIDLVILAFSAFIGLTFLKWTVTAIKNIQSLYLGMQRMGRAAPGLAASLAKFALVNIPLLALAFLIHRVAEETDIATNSASTFADEAGKGFEDVRDKMGELVNGASRFERTIIKMRNLVRFPFTATIEERNLEIVQRKIGETVTSIQKQLAKIEEGEIELPKVSKKSVDEIRTSLENIGWELASSIAQGRIPDIDTSALSEVEEALSSDLTGSLDEASEALARYREAFDAANLAAKDWPPHLRDAAEALVELREEFAPLGVEEEKVRANLAKLEANMEGMLEVIEKLAGDQFPIYEAELNRIRLQQEKLGTSTRTFQTELANTISTLERDVVITKSDGAAKAAASREQAVWNARLSSGLFITNEYGENIKTLTEEQQKQLKVIESLAERQHDLNQLQNEAARTKGSEQALAVAQQELDLVRASGRERAIAMAELAKEHELLNDKVEEGSEHWKEQIRLAKELVEIDFAKQHEEAIVAIEDKLKLLNKEIELGASTVSYREEEIARLKDLIELEAQYGDKIELINKELAGRAQIREAQRNIEHQNQLRAMRDTMRTQDAITRSALQSEVTRKQAVALAEKENELIERYNSLSDERAQRELEVFKALQARERMIETEFKAVADAFEVVMSSMEDTLVEFVKTGKLNFQELADSILADIFRITLRLSITDPLRDWLGGKIGGWLGGQLPDGGIADQALKNVAQMDVTAANVNINGATGALAGLAGGTGAAPGSFRAAQEAGMEAGAAAGAAAGSAFEGEVRQGAIDTFSSGVIPKVGIDSRDMPVLADSLATGLTNTMDPIQNRIDQGFADIANTQSVGTQILKYSLDGGFSSVTSGVENVATKIVDIPSGVQDAIMNASKVSGISTQNLATLANIESRFNPNAKSPYSSAAGLMQFTSGTAREMGLTNVYDANESALAAARLWQQNADTLQKTLGRMPDPWELYMAHQQGIGGAKAILGGDPNASAFETVKGLYRSESTALDAIRNNIPASYGMDPRTVTNSQFGGVWQDMWNKNLVDIPGGMPGMGGMGGGGLDVSGLQSQFDSLQTSVSDVTSGLTDAAAIIPQSSMELANGLGTAATGAQDLAFGALPQTTMAMNQLGTATTTQAVTGAVSSGTADIQQAGAAQGAAAGLNAAAAAAQNFAAQGAGGLGGMLGGGGGLLGQEANLVNSWSEYGLHPSLAMGSGLFHSGGVVGATGVPSVLSGLSGWSGPRLHSGLMPNEFKAVLKRNEAVFNEEQLKVLGQGISSAARGRDEGGGNNISVQITTPNPEAFRNSRGQIEAMLSAAVDNGRRNR